MKPASLLLCIEEGTSLVIRGIDYVIPLGFAILFNGNVEHGGAAYRLFNVRVHMYFNVDAVPAPYNIIFPIRKSPIKRVVISIKGTKSITIVL